MITEEISKLVEEACRKESNSFGYGAWSHHIASVAKYARILAKKLGADVEICELAAYLHDYASVYNKDWYPEHHLYGATLAGDVLESYGYPQERVEMVKYCIVAHRASKDIKRETLEAEIIASADAMAHFDNVDSLLYLAYTKHKMGIDEGAAWVLAKLERSWDKMMPEAKNLIREKYEAIRKSLGDEEKVQNL
jgi:putative nucleotidyltransferase with HDIG domain